MLNCTETVSLTIKPKLEMKRRLIFGLFAMMFVLSTNVTIAQTQITSWEGLCSAINANPAGDFVLASNIVVSGNSHVTANVFSGTLDGAGYTITFAEGSTRTSGLFNTVTGTVSNLNVSGGVFDIQEGTSINMVEMHFGLICDILQGGTIRGCLVRNCTVQVTIDAELTGSFTSMIAFGGLVGCMRYDASTIEYSEFAGTLNIVMDASLGATFGEYVGGLVGYTRAGSITGCFNSGTIHATFPRGITNEMYVSGIATIAGGDTNEDVTISNCYSTSVQTAIANDSHINTISNLETANKKVNCLPSEQGSTYNPAPVWDGTTQCEQVQDSVDVLNSGLAQYNGEYAWVNVQEADANGNITCRVAFRPTYVGAGSAIVGEHVSKPGDWNEDDPEAWETTEDQSENPEHSYVISDGSSVIFDEKVWTNSDQTEEASITVKDGGELVANVDLNNVTIEKEITGGIWNFIGFPIQQTDGLRSLAAVDFNIWAVPYDYNACAWSQTEDDWLHWNPSRDDYDYIDAGNGIFIYPETDGTIAIQGTPQKHNAVITVTKTLKQDGEGARWIALANPFTEKMDVSLLSTYATNQGQVVYLWDGETFNSTSTGTIAVGEGFFVNHTTTGEVSVNLSLTGGEVAAKSAVATREFLTVSVSTDGYKVPVEFALNPAASAEYDIYNANKIFGSGTVAEPYLVSNGYNLCKEEVNALPYVAPMNIKSYEARTIEISADLIPEAYTLTLVDGEEEIEMHTGDVYSAEIENGDNANRFSLKIGKNAVSIQDVAKAEDLNIRNNNRHIMIDGGNNIEVEVYNALGQRVYNTREHNFDLNGVAAGAYVVKVKSGSVSHSTKIVVR